MLQAIEKSPLSETISSQSDGEISFSDMEGFSDKVLFLHCAQNSELGLRGLFGPLSCFKSHPFLIMS